MQPTQHIKAILLITIAISSSSVFYSCSDSTSFLEISPGFIAPAPAGYDDDGQPYIDAASQEGMDHNEEKARRGLCLFAYCPNRAVREVSMRHQFHFPNLPGAPYETKGDEPGSPNSCEKHLATAKKAMQKGVDSIKEFMSTNPQCNVVYCEVVVR